jgi:GDPmannose 4,6-dehydratase
MWLILQAEEADDYVVATGEAHTVEEFVAAAFDHVGLDWREHVTRDESLLRGAADSPALLGDPAKIRERLGWEPEVRFDELVRRMVDADVEALRAQAAASAR